MQDENLVAVLALQDCGGRCVRAMVACIAGVVVTGLLLAFL